MGADVATTRVRLHLRRLLLSAHDSNWTQDPVPPPSVCDIIRRTYTDRRSPPRLRLLLTHVINSLFSLGKYKLSSPYLHLYDLIFFCIEAMQICPLLKSEPPSVDVLPRNGKKNSIALKEERGPRLVFWTS